MTDISESSIFEIDPTQITVKEDLPRQRKELGEIEKLAESIQKFGQLLPVIINKNNELIAGGRRLAACLLLNRKVRVCFNDAVEPLLMREIELEENLQRKDLTPSEKILAIDDLVKLKQQIHGVPVQGKEGGFTLDNAADLLNVSHGTVAEAVQLAAFIRDFPAIGKCGTTSEIKKAAKTIVQTARRAEALVSYEDTIKKTKDFILVNRKAEEYLPGIGDNSIDLFFSDPPYGIDIHEVAMTVGGQTGGEVTTTGTEYEDKFENVQPLLSFLCKESYRVTKSTGHAYIFCGRDRFIFQFMYDQMTAAGWIVLKWPIVWIKRETGQNNQPSYWPSSAYEAILFARKVDSRLILEGRPDWIQCEPVLPSVRVHQAEKPVALCKELISRCCLPGQYLLDPCTGSGAILEAGVQLKVLSLGSESDLNSYAAAAERLSRIVKN